MKIFISTLPFGEVSKNAFDILEERNIDFDINPYKRKITELELLEIISDYDGLIAGTEPITKRVLNNASNLKVISRLGVGTDNIDLEYANSMNIKIEVTHDAPTNSVAEHTIALILNMLRHINKSDKNLKNGIWEKKMGKELSECTIGIVGAGKIGLKVMQLISTFQPKSILYTDPFHEVHETFCEKANLKNLLEDSDIVSLHLPLNEETKYLIGEAEIEKMKIDSLLINTSRGELIDETSLYKCLLENTIGGAALDVFSEEPYTGPLTKLDNCLLTPHIAPMTNNARARMEVSSVRNLIQHLED